MTALGQGHTVAARQRSQRLGKRQPLDPHHEVEHRAAHAASEAMKKSALGIDRKRRRLLIVERAEADEVAAGAPQAHVRADNLDDIGARAHLFDLVVAVNAPSAAHHASQALGIVRHDTVNPASISRRISVRINRPRYSLSPRSMRRDAQVGGHQIAARIDRRRAHRGRVTITRAGHSLGEQSECGSRLQMAHDCERRPVEARHERRPSHCAPA